MSGRPSLREQRKRKVEELRESGYQPYANDFRPELTCADVLQRHEHDSDDTLASTQRIYTVAGRVTAVRSFGKSTFLNLLDRTGSLQIYVKKQKVGESIYAHLKTVDLGDIVGVAGSPFRTKTGELTLAAEGFRILTKSLLPPPEKWAGLTNVETRYRQRYVDLYSNPQVRTVFQKRAAIISQIRRFLDVRDYLEVETPILQDIAGGAAAAPFTTHHNSLGQDLYLRIATELHLKRLVVGGLERVYEIGRCFRNEGLSRKHNPEFTSLEFYQAYATADDLVELTQDLFQRLAEKVADGETLDYQGQHISLRAPFKKIKLANAVAEHLGVAPLDSLDSIAGAGEVILGHTNDCDPIDVVLSDLDDDEISKYLPGAVGDNPSAIAESVRQTYLKSEDRQAALLSLCHDLDQALEPVRRRAIGLHLLFAVFEHEVEETLIQPTFITHYPRPASPLAREFDQDPAVVDRFELFIGGMEVANAFSELTDPLEQRERFERQMRLRARGDDEASELDGDFLQALEVGMPPTAGEGIGIDRLTMLFCDASTIREVILFPQLRRIEQTEKGDEQTEKNDSESE